MKVKDIMPKKEKLDREFKNLQLLEKLFKNNHELAEEIADKAGLNLPLDKLLTEVRMTYFDNDEMSRVSSVNEAASIIADSDDIVYKIKSLFNNNL